MKNQVFLIFASLFINPFINFSQAPQTGFFHSRIYDKDSLKGFDENAAGDMILAGKPDETEYLNLMDLRKREYINHRYSLIKPIIYKSNNSLPENRSAEPQGCNNEDFESSSAGQITSSNQISGWTLSKGFNSLFLPTSGTQATVTPYYPTGNPGATSCNMTLFPLPPLHSSIVDCSMPGGCIDPQIGTQYPVYSVFGTGTPNASASVVNPQLTGPMYGNRVLRLNDGVTGDYSIEKLSRTIAVTNNNTLFQFAFISVFAAGHTCCDAPLFIINIKNITTNSIIACGSFSVSEPGAGCPLINSYVPQYLNCGSGTIYTPMSSGNLIYNPWKINSVDLSAYIGEIVTIDIIVSDCTQGGHYGKLYFDAQCGQMNININNKDFAADSVINYVNCDSSFVLKAPVYFPSYQWAGPGGITSTTSILNTNVPGSYTLTLGCTAPRIINLSFSPPAMISSPASIMCIGYPAILTAVGLNNCVWSTGDSTQSIYVAPLVNTTYTVSGVNQFGCSVSATITQTVINCTGIDYLENKHAIALYPNPNNGEFTLNINGEIIKGELVIETTFGQAVHKQAVIQGKNTIKTKGLSPGVYYYTLSDNKHVVSKGKLKID